eukprot:7107382-Heterocapsa_arctica.AAC.1
MQVRLEARLAAEAIRNKGQAVAAAGETLYAVSLDKLKIPAFESLLGDVAALPDADQPFVLKQSDKMQLWLADAVIEKTLASFAGTHKKAKDSKATGRCQYPLQTKYGKEETQEFVKDFLPKDILDISESIEGGQSFMDSLWLYSFLPGKRPGHVSIPANCGALLKAHVIGQVDTVIIEVASLKDYTEKNKLEGYDNLG